MARLHIAVVGAGIVGVSTAEWLRRDGHQVTLIDRAAPGQGTSFGNAGVIARCSVVPVPVPGLLKKVPAMLRADGPLFLRWSYLPRLLPWLLPYLRNASRDRVVAIAEGLAHLVADAWDQHQSLARGTPAEAFLRASDYLFLYTNRAAFDGDRFGWSIRADHGFVGEERDAAALRDLDPALNPRYAFGYAMPDHGYVVDPAAYVAALADWFSGQGGTLTRADVAAIRPTAAGVELDTDAGLIAADQAVLATGVWSKRLAEKLGHRISLESERGYHIEFAEPSHRPVCPYMVADTKFVATPMTGGVRAAGLVEFGGLAAGPSTGPQRLLETGIKRIYPDFSYASKRVWLGHRPATADSLPMLGPSPRAANIHFAFGHQHVGLTAGPKTGRLVADAIARRRSNVDLTPFRVDRFD